MVLSSHPLVGFRSIAIHGFVESDSVLDELLVMVLVS